LVDRTGAFAWPMLGSSAGETMFDIRRRELIALLGSAAIGSSLSWPLAAHAQQPKRTRRIGVLMGISESDPERQSLMSAFTRTLADLGWRDGSNIRIDYRWGAGDSDRIRSLARELVELQPDLIVGHTTPAVAALRQQTRTIPIVFIQVSDPVGSGFVAGFAEPGGNITGFTNLESSMSSKLVELLKEVAPGVTRIALMFNPDTAPAGGSYFLRPVEAAASALRVKIIPASVHNAADIDTAIAALARDPGAGLIVMPDVFVLAHREQILALAERHRVPAAYAYRLFATSGGLMSYGTDLVDLFRRAPPYIDRILKGAKPGELPVQQPIKFELVVNLKTANALGLAIPDKLIALADEVIE
jgi:putative tryptophan/tyrosine transport system substrate-binding protein